MVFPDISLLPGGSIADTSPGNATKMTAEERDGVLKAGAAFEQAAQASSPGSWLLIAGELGQDPERQLSEDLIRTSCLRAFGYPSERGPSLTVNVLLHSSGGMLDSAY